MGDSGRRCGFPEYARHAAAAVDLGSRYWSTNAAIPLLKFLETSSRRVQAASREFMRLDGIKTRGRFKQWKKVRIPVSTLAMGRGVGWFLCEYAR